MEYCRFESLCYSNEFHIKLVVLHQIDGYAVANTAYRTLCKVIFLSILHGFLHMKVEELLQWKYYSIHSKLLDNI